MKKPLLVSLPILLLALPAGVRADSRPTVAVAFDLAEPIYRAEIGDGEQALEDAVTAKLVSMLNDAIGFLRFQTAPGDYQLLLRLGDPAASTAEFHEVGFHLGLRGIEGVQGEIYKTFREDGGWGVSTGTADAFRDEIVARLALAGFRDLLPGLLSLIPVAKSGAFLHQQPLGLAWILPVPQSEPCMDNQSELELSTTITTAIGALPLSYRANPVEYHPVATGGSDLGDRLLCIPVDGDGRLDLLEQSEPAAVRIERVFVLDYRRRHDGCAGPAPPAVAVPDIGGAP